VVDIFSNNQRQGLWVPAFALVDAHIFSEMATEYEKRESYQWSPISDAQPS